MNVLIDTNEKATNPRVYELTKKLFPNAIDANLETGDMNVILDGGRRVAIERKSPSDFLASIGDGRLFDQVDRMAQFDAYCVIVTGAFGYDSNDMVTVRGKTTNWNGKAVRAAMVAIQMSACPIINSGNSNGYARAAWEFIEFCQKPPQRSQKASRVVTFPPLTAAEQVLANFPGVGVKRAKALLGFVGGGLGEAIEWGSSVIPLLRNEAKPEFWGEKTIINFRAALSLGENQIMKVVEVKDENQ